MYAYHHCIFVQYSKGVWGVWFLPGGSCVYQVVTLAAREARVIGGAKHRSMARQLQVRNLDKGEERLGIVRYGLQLLIWCALAKLTLLPSLLLLAVPQTSVVCWQSLGCHPTL